VSSRTGMAFLDQEQRSDRYHRPHTAAPATSTPKRAPLQASVSWDNALGVRSSPRHQRPITPADTASVCSPTKKRKRAAAVEDDDEWTPSPPKMRHG
jgi:hypothetical protein